MPFDGNVHTISVVIVTYMKWLTLLDHEIWFLGQVIPHYRLVSIRQIILFDTTFSLPFGSSVTIKIRHTS